MSGLSHVTSKDPASPGRRDSTLLDLQDFVENGSLGLSWIGEDGIILAANRADYEPLGYAKDEFVGHPLRDFYASPAAADELLERLIAGECVLPHEAALRCHDGSVRHVTVTARARFDEQRRLLHVMRCTSEPHDRASAQREGRLTQQEAIEQEPSERQSGERTLEPRVDGRALSLLATVSRAVVERGIDLDDVFQRIAQEVSEALGDCCAVHLLSPDQSLLHLRGFHHREAAARSQIAAQRPLPSDRGICREVLGKGRPLRLAHVELETLSELFGSECASEFFAQFMAHSLLVVPLAMHERPLGILAVWRESDSPYGDDDERLLCQLGDRVAVAIMLAEQHAELTEMVDAVRRSNEQLRRIAEASDRFGQSLDYERTLQSLISLTIPALGDFGYLNVREGEALRRISHAGELPELQALLEQTTSIDDAPAELGVSALASGRAHLHTTLDPAFIAELARTPEDRTLLEKLAPRSMITVPLTYQSEIIGALTLFYGPSGRIHGEQELALAVELARRAAAALVNARLFKEAREAIGVRDDFLSIAGHELRTPLTALQLQILSISKMMAQPDNLEKIAGRADKAAKNVLRLSSLVNELLDISRISAGRLRLERSPVQLSDAVRDVLNRQAEELARNGCTLSFQPRQGPPGLWDKARIEQITANLIANAMKYGKGKPIEVTIDHLDGLARLTVRDHGIGISPEDQQRIFQRFERAVSSRHFGGLGLGLWIARQLVDAHGGTIRVNSQQDQGATFEVELPLAPLEEVQA